MLFLFALHIYAIYFSPHEEREFIEWMKEHHLFFYGLEYFARLGIFHTHKRMIEEHNRVHEYKIHLNQFSHLTNSEYISLLGFNPAVFYLSKRFVNTEKSKFKCEDNLDWREKGAVNPIKDQGHCGSCWAFSTIQSFESAYFLKNGHLLSFSESNLVDCVDTCNGCNGGSMRAAFEYILYNQQGKLMLEKDYPYSPFKSMCKFDESKSVGVFKGFIGNNLNDEEDLQKKCCQYGCASIAIDASQLTFQLYHKGIYDDPKCRTHMLNHGVGCVGYGTENGQNYWIIRNSWGIRWGELGYIRIARGRNRCGIGVVGLFAQA